MLCVDEAAGDLRRPGRTIIAVGNRERARGVGVGVRRMVSQEVVNEGFSVGRSAAIQWAALPLIGDASHSVLTVPSGRFPIRGGEFDKAPDWIGERVAVEGGGVVSEQGRRRAVGIGFLQDAVQSVVTRRAIARCSIPIAKTGLDATSV